MMEHDPTEIEESLGRLVPKPAPPGLRRRVLDSAFEARKNVALTPRMRAVATVCLVLTSIVMIGDAVISKRQSGHIAALLNAGSATDEGELARMEASDLAELAGIQGTEAAKLLGLQARIRSAVREERQRRFGEALKGLRGWSEYETSEDIN